MNRTLFSNRPARFMRGIAIIASFFFLPLFVSAQTYDDYLLATQKVGETLGEGIKGGVENTQQLYRSAWNELMSLGSAKVGPSLASYAEYSNNLGDVFATTFIQGMGASQEFSQTIWNADPYGAYAAFSHNTGARIAQGIKSGVKGSADLYAQSLTKTKQLVQKTPDLKLAVNTDGVANITDVWNSTTNYFSNLWGNLTTSTQPQPATNSAPPTTAKPPTPAKPAATPAAPKPPATPKQPAPSATTKVTVPTVSPVQPLVIQNTVERVLSGITSADLELKIQQLRNELVSKIGAVAGQTQSNYQNNFAAIALTNKIDQLTNTVITTPTITGGSITNASISGGSISGTSASLSGAFTGTTGTFSGLVTAGTFGIGTTSPSDTFALNGAAYFAQVSAPSVTVNRLYNESGNLTWNGSVIGGASTGQWTLSGSDVYRSSGNVGIGTTSPFAKLSVQGLGTGTGVNFQTTNSSQTPLVTVLDNGMVTFAPSVNDAVNGGTAITESAMAQPSGTVTGSFTGFQGTIGYNSASFTSGGVTGVKGQGTVYEGGANTTQGVWGIAQYQGTGTYTGSLYGGRFQSQLTSTGNVTHVIGIKINGPTIVAGATANQTFGLYVQDLNSNNLGTVTGNSAAIQIEGAGASNAIGFSGNGGSGVNAKIYSSAVNQLNIEASSNLLLNTLGGNVGIGTSTPNNLLSVYDLIDFDNTNSNTKIGYQTGKNFISQYNTFLGYQAGMGGVGDATADYNTGVGYRALYSNTTGTQNTANGYYSLYSNTTGSYNTANGRNALRDNTTGSYNVAEGAYAAQGAAAYSNQGGTYVGYASGYSAGTGSDYNTLIGYLSGYGVTTGARNLLLGYKAGYSGTNLTTGSDNIIIGNNIGATSTTMTRGLNIGNLIFGTGIDGTGTTLSSGNVGIGTTSPYAKLSVVGEAVAANFTATSTTATTTIAGGLNVGNGAILYDYSTGVASVGNLELGSLNFDTNAGTVNWMDMPVTSAAAAGTVESYSAQLDGTALITAYSQSDGAGNIKLSAVGIGTTTPSARLTVTTASTTELIPLFTVASSTGASIMTVNYDGKVGIGTTTSAINNTLVVQGGVCITGGTTCPAVSSGSLRVDTAGVAGADDPGDVFDVAERYPAKEVMSAGEIVAIDMDAEDKAVVKKGTQGDVLLGIVSTRAAVAINGSDLTLAPAGEATSTKPLIALVGRVPVKVINEGGDIKKGDKITASSVPGVGMRATSTVQQTVGIALEGWSGEGEGTVLVFVQTGTSRLDPAIADGTILDGNGESSFWSVEEGSGRIKFISQGIDLNDQDLVSVRAIVGSAGKWSIDASGRLVVNEVQTNKLCVGETCVTQDEFKKVFGETQTAQVSINPPRAEEETGAPSSTPPVIEEPPATEEATTEEPIVVEEEVVVPEPQPESASAPEPAVNPTSAPESAPAS